MQLFKMGEKDYTSHITVPSYAVYAKEYYVDWKDGRHMTHKDVYCKKFEGSFTLYFDNADDYFEFMKTLAENTSEDGWTECTLYDMKTNRIRTAEVSLDMSPANTLPFMGVQKHDGFSVSVKER